MRPQWVTFVSRCFVAPAGSAPAGSSMSPVFARDPSSVHRKRTIRAMSGRSVWVNRDRERCLIISPLLGEPAPYCDLAVSAIHSQPTNPGAH